MARIETLKERIENAEKRIESKRNTIVKKQGWIAKRNAKIAKGNLTENERYWETCEVNHLNEDILRLEREIAEIEKTVETYRKQLSGEIERQSTLIKEVPETMKRLQNELVERWDKYDIDWREHLCKCYKEMSSREFFDAFRRSGYEHMYKTDAEIHKENVRDAESAILNLLYRVREITGEVTDWGRLEISGGVLNGYVVGKMGRCFVETIGAGGYNIQRYHLRVLVKKIN